MEPTRLTIARSSREHAARLSMAGLAVIAWVCLVMLDVFLSAMFFSSPSPGMWLVTSPLLAAAAWIAWVTSRRGEVEVHHDRLVIRHPRVLRRPLVVPREQVARVLLDDGAATGGARFFTGDEREPLLWTDPLPRRQHADRPLIGDGIVPNVAVVLARPLAITGARDPLTAAPAPGDVPPPRPGEARALLLALEDLPAARFAFAGWNVQEAGAAQVIPPQVAAAAARVPVDAATLLLLAAFAAALTIENQLIGYVIWVPAALALVMRMQRRRQRQAAEARADVAGRPMTPAQRAAALAAIDANLGAPPSQGPPV